MAFAAPEVAGAARAATAAKGAGTAAKATTARARGEQLLAAGMSRRDAAKAIRDEFGSSLSEAAGVLPPEQPATPQTERRAEPTSDPRPAGRSSSSRGGWPSPARSGGFGASFGGLVLGAMAWAVGLTFLRSGWPGVTALLRAKFLNQTTTPGAVSPTPRQPTPGSSGTSGLGPAAIGGGGLGGSSGGVW